MAHSKGMVIGFWIVTALFCLQMGFTAFAELRLPQVAEAFTHLGFPAYFRVELSWAKVLGVVLLLAPVPARLKEWAYAGFAINLVSALIAHVAVGDGPQGVGLGRGHRRALGTLVLLLAPPAGPAGERLTAVSNRRPGGGWPDGSSPLRRGFGVGPLGSQRAAGAPTSACQSLCRPSRRPPGGPPALASLKRKRERLGAPLPSQLPKTSVTRSVRGLGRNPAADSAVRVW